MSEPDYCSPPLPAVEIRCRLAALGVDVSAEAAAEIGRLTAETFAAFERLSRELAPDDDPQAFRAQLVQFGAATVKDGA